MILAALLTGGAAAAANTGVKLSLGILGLQFARSVVAGGAASVATGYTLSRLLHRSYTPDDARRAAEKYGFAEPI
jgi:hypothetical protein